MQEQSGIGLKAGVTKSNVSAQKILKKPTKLTSQVTRMAGVSGTGTNMKKGNKSKMKSNTSERDRENEIVKFNDQIVTPKKLITDKFKEMAQKYLAAIQDAQDKKKNQKSSNTGKQSSSIVENSMRSHQQSADKSSSSDIKMSSSNAQEKSSFMDSKKSDDTYSDSDSRRDQSEAVEKKSKKIKGYTEEELDENVAVNLSETETIPLFFIPSAIILQELGQQNGLIQLNKNYEILLTQKVGSDNYTDRPAQTFNFEAKQKDQQSTRVEKNDAGSFAAVWDLYDARMSYQPTEFEQLKEDIKNNIEREMYDKRKNPFYLLQTEMQAISIHSRKEVPGSTQYLAEKLLQGPKNRSNQQKNVVPSLSGGQTNFQQSGQNNNNNNNNNNDRDDSVKNSSTQQTGTKIGPQQTVFQISTKIHGRTNQQLQQQQMLLLQQQQQQQLEVEEEEYLKEIVEKVQKQPNDQEQRIMHSETLFNSLSYVERILNQNLYHKQYIQYRNYPEVKFEKMTMDDDIGKRGLGGFRRAQNVQKIEEEDTETANDKKSDNNPISSLFKYSCDLTQERTISSADWNPQNQDLLAVSYGEFELNANIKKEGYIMFWTLKNPTYPERIIKYPSRITTCKFSESNPNLIAAGTYDGVVAIYDIRRKEGTPVAQNKEMQGKHNDAVWEVQWVGRGNNGGDKETLVSISADSRVVEWSMKKGLEYTDLMNLKRQSPPSQKDNLQEGVNFRWAGGFSFDFLRGESSMYLVATDEGTVHRCSKSYAEQYLDSYFGHSGPIYKVRCNPFVSDLFLTCSADWSCKLWNWREETAITNFQSLDLYDEVLDTEWSPNSSTLFASVCKDGRLEMWDLCKNNMLDPFAQIKPPEGIIWPAKTTVRFGRSCPIVITGDTAGDLQVFRLNGYEDFDFKQQQDKIVKLLYPSGYQKGGKEKHE